MWPRRACVSGLLLIALSACVAQETSLLGRDRHVEISDRVVQQQAAGLSHTEASSQRRLQQKYSLPVQPASETQSNAALAVDWLPGTHFPALGLTVNTADSAAAARPDTVAASATAEQQIKSAAEAEPHSSSTVQTAAITVPPATAAQAVPANAATATGAAEPRVDPVGVRNLAVTPTTDIEAPKAALYDLASVPTAETTSPAAATPAAAQLVDPVANTATAAAAVSAPAAARPAPVDSSTVTAATASAVAFPMVQNLATSPNSTTEARSEDKYDLPPLSEPVRSTTAPVKAAEPLLAATTVEPQSTAVTATRAPAAATVPVSAASTGIYSPIQNQFGNVLMQPTTVGSTMPLGAWKAAVAPIETTAGSAAQTGIAVPEPLTAPEQQKQLLLSTILELAGSTPEALASWTPSSDMCTSWQGIRCNSEGLVVGISLISEGLSGTLPASWSALTSLQLLTLARNNLSGVLPDSWGLLVNLKLLGLRGNQLSGDLPSSWGGMTNLTYLYLSGNKLSGSLPHSWSQLSQLQLMYLNNNQITGQLPLTWWTMTSLTGVDLSRNDLSGSFPLSWGSIPTLSWVGFYNNPSLEGCLPRIWSVRNFYMLALNGAAESGTAEQPSSTAVTAADETVVGEGDVADAAPAAAGSAAVTVGEGSRVPVGLGADRGSNIAAAVGPLAGTAVTGWCPRSVSGQVQRHAELVEGLLGSSAPSESNTAAALGVGEVEAPPVAEPPTPAAAAADVPTVGTPIVAEPISDTAEAPAAIAAAAAAVAQTSDVLTPAEQAAAAEESATPDPTELNTGDASSLVPAVPAITADAADADTTEGPTADPAGAQLAIEPDTAAQTPAQPAAAAAENAAVGAGPAAGTRTALQSVPSDVVKPLKWQPDWYW